MSALLLALAALLIASAWRVLPGRALVELEHDAKVLSGRAGRAEAPVCCSGHGAAVWPLPTSTIDRYERSFTLRRRALG